MRVRRFVSLGALVCTALAVPAVGAGAVDSDEVKVPDVLEVGGGAQGLYMEVEEDSIGPVAVVELPADGGGPFTDEELVFENLFVEAWTEGAIGADGYAVSGARFTLEDTLSIETECVADATGVSGTTTIDAPPEMGLPENPEVDEEIEIIDADNGIRTVALLNEQVVSSDGQSISVIGVQFTNYLLDTDEPMQSGWYGAVECAAVLEDLPAPTPSPEAAPAAAARVEPTFTG